LPRKRDIEAAIAAHNNTNDRGLQFLPPDAVRLLVTMFPRKDVCQRSVEDLAAQELDVRSVRLLLRALVRFLSEERRPGARQVSIGSACRRGGSHETGCPP
jgi:hypothetical protein